MTLYIPGFSELTLAETYRMRGWTASYGCNKPYFPYRPPPGWKCDPSYPEVSGGTGTHGGCPSCWMVELQVIANYQTEITFISNPPGAQIFIDGAEWWPGAVTAADGATFRGIAPGTHTYELRMAGYVSATGTFDLILNTPVTINKTLYSTSCVPVWQCEPDQTGYEADGCGNRRLNPVCNPCVPSWTCEIPLNGYEADGCGNRRANTACLPIVAKGSIKFINTPPGAEVFLDGTYQGVKTPVTITDIPAGSHEYSLKLAGFLDSTGTVQVVENQTADVSAALIPVESCIYFMTSVPGARIYVDNADTGKVTPDLVCGLSLAAHTYRLVLPGYAVITGSVMLGAGQGATITGTLVPEAKKGIGAMAVVTLLGLGVLGAVIFASRGKKQGTYNPPTGR